VWDQVANPFTAEFQLIAREIGRGDTSLLPILVPRPPHQKKRSVVCRCGIGQKNRSAILASE